MIFTFSLLSVTLLIFSLYVPMKISIYFPEAIDLFVFNRCIGNLNYVEKDGKILNITRTKPGLDFLYYDCGKEYYCSLSSFTKNEPDVNLKIYVSESDPSECYTCINMPADGNSGFATTVTIFSCMISFLTLLLLSSFCYELSNSDKSECQCLSETWRSLLRLCYGANEYEKVSIVGDENL